MSYFLFLIVFKAKWISPYVKQLNEIKVSVNVPKNQRLACSILPSVCCSLTPIRSNVITPTKPVMKLEVIMCEGLILLSSIKCLQIP